MKTPKNYLIDISENPNQSLGRLATKIAMILRGKDRADFTPNQVANSKVKIVNAGELNMNEAKKSELYISYSGHPGGQKMQSREHVIENRGMKEVIKRAVLRMLPNNKLRAQIIKNLEITD